MNKVELEQGLVIVVYGCYYLVQVGEQKLNCVICGKKSDVVVGDYICLVCILVDQGVVESIDECCILFYCLDQYKFKLLVVNVD